jgi:hypothetical protein
MVGVIVDESKDQEIIERMKIDDYKLFKLPKAVQSVYTTFPFSSVFSVSIAAMRVPSRVIDFIQVTTRVYQSIDFILVSILDKQIKCSSFY